MLRSAWLRAGPVSFRSGVQGDRGKVPLGLQETAKGGEQGTQLACGSNKCPLFSNAFSREPRGSHASGIRHPCPEAVLRWGMGDMEKRKKRFRVGG